MTNETRIIISGILAVVLALFMAKTKRRKGNIFYPSPVFVFFCASFVFTLGVWFFFEWFDIYTDPDSVERSSIEIIVLPLIFWLVPVFMLIFALSQRYEIKDKILAKKDLFPKTEYIDISRITSIEIIYNYESHHFQANMCDGTSRHIDASIENKNQLFYRMGQINDNIHFRFPIDPTAEDSFFARSLNLGTIIAVPVYAVGFFLLLGRIMRAIGV